MNLENIKLESYVSVACFLLALFFKIAFIIAIVLQLHIIYMLKQDSQSATIFKSYTIALLANLAYIMGLALVSPSISASIGFNTFYVGFVVAIISAPILFGFALRFAKEVVVITESRLFLAIMGFVVVEFLAGLMWVLSYLWHWLGIAHGFRNMDGNAIVISAIGAFVVSALLIFAVIMTDEIHTNGVKSNDKPTKSAESTP